MKKISFLIIIFFSLFFCLTFNQTTLAANDAKDSSSGVSSSPETVTPTPKACPGTCYDATCGAGVDCPPFECPTNTTLTNDTCDGTKKCCAPTAAAASGGSGQAASGGTTGGGGGTVSSGSTVSLADVSPVKGITGDASGVAKLIGLALNAILGIVGAIALLMFVYGGIVIIIGSGNPSEISKGKQVMIWATIGLAVILGSAILSDFVVKSITEGVSSPSGPVAPPGSTTSTDGSSAGATPPTDDAACKATNGLCYEVLSTCAGGPYPTPQITEANVKKCGDDLVNQAIYESCDVSLCDWSQGKTCCKMEGAGTGSTGSTGGSGTSSSLPAGVEDTYCKNPSSCVDTGCKQSNRSQRLACIINFEDAHNATCEMNKCLSNGMDDKVNILCCTPKSAALTATLHCELPGHVCKDTECQNNITACQENTDYYIPGAAASFKGVACNQFCSAQ